MPSRAPHFCNQPGCNVLTNDTYCDLHRPIHAREQDKRRGTATERGYDNRWRKYSKWFLSQPENQICKLHLDGCTLIARCVDHINPPSGRDDPLFWDTSNHQASCIHCNSVKGHTHIKGEYEL